jgi:hypothetical protein
MATVVYRTLADLEPVELKYQYNYNEVLQTETIGYTEGLNLQFVDGFNNFQDFTINRESCFVLTTAVNLSSIFQKQPSKELGQIPLTLKIQSTPTSPGLPGSFYAIYNSDTGLIIKTATTSAEAANFFFNPIDINELKVEIQIGKKYLQTDTSYPYTIRVGDKITDRDQLYRQYFYCENYNNRFALKTLTDVGFRYLTFCNCGTLRGTGVILNNDIVNNYLLSAINLTDKSVNYDFIPNNKWITYYLDFPSQVSNKDVSLNKTFDTQINFLVDFPLLPAITNKSISINIANLKTGLTPTSTPPQIDNSYNEQIITTN